MGPDVEAALAGTPVAACRCRVSSRFAICLGLAAVAATAASCDADMHEVTMRIDHYREPCPGGEPGFCLRVLDSSDPAIAAPDEIEGFDFHAGRVYEIVVLVANDGSEPEFDLIDVVSETPVPDDERFEIELAPGFIERVENREFQLVAHGRAYCLTTEVCQAVGKAVVEGRRFAVELSHHPEDSGAFFAHAVTELD
jgi:hypothetical protein